MKFWELSSVCREEKDLFMKILNQEEWKKYYDHQLNLAHYLNSGDRSILDSEAPEKLCVEVFLKVKMKFRLTDYGILRVHKDNPHPDSPNEGKELSALETYRLYGDFYMEEAREKGGVQLSFGIPESYRAS